jgi:PAS domain S-box-containing protein
MAAPRSVAQTVRRVQASYLGPALVCAVVVGASVVLWRSLNEQHDAEIRRATQAELDSVTSEVGSRMEAHLLALVRMAKRWEVRAPARAEWEADARLLAEHYPGTQALVRVAPEARAEWVVPLETNDAIEGADLGIDERRRALLDATRATGEPRMMRTFDLLEGHRGALVVVPIRRGAEFLGYIASVFRTQELLEAMLRNVAEGYAVSVFDGLDELYFRRGASRVHELRWRVVAPVRLAGAHWQVRVWPTPELLAARQSLLAITVLSAGIVLGVLLGLAIHLAERARLQAVETDAVNRELAHEVSERKRAEEAASHLASIVNSSDDAIVGQTFDGTIVSWNAGAERLFGYTAGEMRGRPIASLLPADRWPPMAAVLARIREGHLVERHETTAQRKDGREVVISATVSPIRDAAGQVVGASAIARDITRRKRAEAELRGTLARLERSSQEQTRSLAATSHDVRGALATIAGYGEMLSEQVTENGARDMALRIAGLAHTLSDIMGELLYYAGAERGGAEVTRVAVSARTLVQKCTDDFRFPCQEKGLALHCDLPAEGTVVTDPAKVTRILQNLLSNAVRYTRQGHVYVRGDLTPTALRLLVRDTGVGIPPADLDRVFEEFYRSPEAKEMEKLGTGLGLATVRRLARLLGGDVRVESTVGAGTTFEVVLPRELSE